MRTVSSDHGRDCLSRRAYSRAIATRARARARSDFYAAPVYRISIYGISAYLSACPRYVNKRFRYVKRCYVDRTRREMSRSGTTDFPSFSSARWSQSRTAAEISLSLSLSRFPHLLLFFGPRMREKIIAKSKSTNDSRLILRKLLEFLVCQAPKTIPMYYSPRAHTYLHTYVHT